MNYHKNYLKFKKQSGFSLMELIVVIAILGILLSVSLFSYNAFGKDIELENAAYTTSLAIREAQTYGINKKAREGNSNSIDNVKDEFGEDYGYGIQFTANSKKFTIFRDDDKDKRLDVGEEYSHIQLQHGNTISEIKGFTTNNNEWKKVDDKLDIYFKRPDPDATFNAKTGGETSYEKVKIIIEDKTKTYSRCIMIGTAGDITIKKKCD